MKLLIDQGNSRLKWALVADDKCFIARGVAMSGEAAVIFVAVAAALPPGQVVSVIAVASVAGRDEQQHLRRGTKDFFGIDPVFLVSRAACAGLGNGYEVPQQLGVDRWLAMLGARAVVSGAVLVVDAGTAMTIDGIRADGGHLGGYIVPGYAMQLAALDTQTAAVGRSSQVPGAGFGRNTGTAVAHGVLLGLAALIDRAQVELEQAVKDTCTVVLTGGDAAVIAPFLKSAPVMEPDLLFRGMVIELAAPG